jgi:hypothetical protein
VAQNVVQNFRGSFSRKEEMLNVRREEIASAFLRIPPSMAEEMIILLMDS